MDIPALEQTSQRAIRSQTTRRITRQVCISFRLSLLFCDFFYWLHGKQQQILPWTRLTDSQTVLRENFDLGNTAHAALIKRKMFSPSPFWSILLTSSVLIMRQESENTKTQN